MPRESAELLLVKMESKINVMVRIKPMSVVDMNKEKNQLWNRVSDNQLKNRRTKELFTYDRVFGPEVNTFTIFNEQVKDLVKNALSGIN